MTYLEAAILGVIQGLTEFLPVSSSGHLVLAEALLGVHPPGVTFEVVVHLGTLLAVLVYFRSRIIELVRSVFDSKMKKSRAFLGYLILGTIPAGVIGVAFRGFFEAAFDSPVMAAVMLLVTGLILLSTRFAPKKKQPTTALRAFLIGLGQAVAILPGISRSGSTISAGLLLGVKPAEAAEFSFLLAVPAIGGAAVLSLDDLSQLPADQMGQYGLGLVVSFVVALGAVYLVLESIRRGKFEYFAYYCFAAGAVGLYLFV
jgi:undecaprenyl-diphosphatase